MEHGEYLVDIINNRGDVIGKKRRKDIDKISDIYKTAHIQLITPTGEVVLSFIKERLDIPNLYYHRYGTTVATIIRSNERAEEAAVRAISRELFIDDAHIHHIGDFFGVTAQDNLTVSASFFYIVGDIPKTYSQTDLLPLEPYSRASVQALIERQPGKFTPIFETLWGKFGKKLPL